MTFTDGVAADDDSQERSADFYEILAAVRYEISDAMKHGWSRAHCWFARKNAKVAVQVANYLRDEEGYAVEVKVDEATGSVSLWIDVPKPEDS